MSNLTSRLLNAPRFELPSTFCLTDQGFPLDRQR
jgi:hypothetical protein